MSRIYRIGTLPNNDIVLSSEYVSRSHADITVMDNGTYVLTDHSKNGTTVNGNRVQNSTVTINYGDNVLFASQVPLDWSRITRMTPYPPLGQTTTPPPPPQPQPTSTNVFALLGLIFSFLAPLVGLILSIVGVKMASSKYNGKGRGMAVAGIIISCILMVCILIYYIFVVAVLSFNPY